MISPLNPPKARRLQIILTDALVVLSSVICGWLIVARIYGSSKVSGLQRMHIIYTTGLQPADKAAR